MAPSLQCSCLEMFKRCGPVERSMSMRVDFEIKSLAPFPICFLQFAFVSHDVSSLLPASACMPVASCHAPHHWGLTIWGQKTKQSLLQVALTMVVL